MDILKKYKLPFKIEGWIIMDSERKVVKKDDILELLNTLHATGQSFEEYFEEFWYAYSWDNSEKGIKPDKIQIKSDMKNGWLARGDSERRELAEDIHIALTFAESKLDKDYALKLLGKIRDREMGFKELNSEQENKI